MSIREAYEKSLHREGHERDAAQEIIVARLADVQEQLYLQQPRHWLSRLFRRGSDPSFVRGLYIWGGVGRGKTFLMDLFYETLAIDGKTMCNAIDDQGHQTHIMSVVGHQSKNCYTQKK